MNRKARRTCAYDPVLKRQDAVNKLLKGVRIDAERLYIRNSGKWIELQVPNDILGLMRNYLRRSVGTSAQLAKRLTSYGLAEFERRLGSVFPEEADEPRVEDAPSGGHTQTAEGTNGDADDDAARPNVVAFAHRTRPSVAPGLRSTITRVMVSVSGCPVPVSLRRTADARTGEVLYAGLHVGHMVMDHHAAIHEAVAPLERRLAGVSEVELRDEAFWRRTVIDSVASLVSLFPRITECDGRCFRGLSCWHD